MANTMVQNYVHIVFRIKSTSILMQRSDLPRIHAYLGGLLKNLGCIPVIVGGVHNHIHALISLSKNIALSGLMRNLKANSSRWIKTLSPNYESFAWQDGYGAFSISPSILGKTIDYIKNQELHHQIYSFADEIKALLDAYNIQYDEKYLFND
ncbi:MAG: transposase [Victivallales bacterium]|nr:transposase [Victivallales bacterium]